MEFHWSLLGNFGGLEEGGGVRGRGSRLGNFTGLVKGILLVSFRQFYWSRLGNLVKIGGL